jgi:hypothetical protein
MKFLKCVFHFINKGDKDIKERLQIVASFAMVNLHDCLVALCSWAAIQRTKSANVAEIFFGSDVLKILYFCILSNPTDWQMPSSNVKAVLVSMFKELTASQDFATWLLEALDRAFTRLGPEHTQFNASSIEYKGLIENIANQLAQGTFAFWSGISSVSPTVVQDAVKELSKYAKSTDIKSWLKSSSDLIPSLQHEQLISNHSLHDRQVHLKAKIHEVLNVSIFIYQSVLVFDSFKCS